MPSRAQPERLAPRPLPHHAGDADAAGWSVSALAARLKAGVTSSVVAVQAAAARSVARLLGGRVEPHDRGPLDPATLRSVLVVRPDEIGDLVLTTPFLRALRAQLPSAHITLVVKAGVATLLERCPYVDEVVAYRVDVARAARPIVLPWRAFQLGRRLRATRTPDLAVLPRWDADLYYATFVALWSGARWRLAFSEQVNPFKRRVNRGFDALLTHAVDSREHRHEVERGVQLLAALGGAGQTDAVDLWLDDTDRAGADRVLRGAGVPDTAPLVALGPSAGHSPLKQWPPGHFAALAGRLRDEVGCHVLVVGGPGEEALGQRIAGEAGGGVTSLVGRTTLRELAAVLARCRVFVGNDTGTMHVAAAAGARVVAVFGGSNHARFRPWGAHAVVSLDLPCSPVGAASWVNRCSYCILDEPRCLTELPVGSVLAAARAAYGTAPAPVRGESATAAR